MKRVGRTAFLLALFLCLTACSTPEESPASSSSAPTVPDTPPVIAATPTPEITVPPVVEPAAGPVEEAIFPRSFGFASGAGGWSTELKVAADGSFTGVYHDSNKGEIGEDYPYGTVYVCHFSGTFSQPVKVDDLTYSMHLEGIEQDET